MLNGFGGNIIFASSEEKFSKNKMNKEYQKNN